MFPNLLPLRFTYTLCVVFVLFLLLLPCSVASPGTSPGDLLYSEVAIINNTSSFQLEVTIDGMGPSVMELGQAERFVLRGKETIGEHQLVAKAYVSTKHIGRRQIGRERTIIFQITGEVQDSPEGKVGWYKVFTEKDFLPQSPYFSTAGYRQSGCKVSNKGHFPAKYQDNLNKDHIHCLIRRASKKYEIPAALLIAVIEVESAFNCKAVSPRGAIGLMQLMPDTCTRFDVRKPFDPQENVEGGSKYLSYLLNQWALRFPSSQRLELALAAYNAGEGNIEVHGGIPPFEETKKYVREVLKRYRSLEKT